MRGLRVIRPGFWLVAVCCMLEVAISAQVIVQPGGIIIRPSVNIAAPQYQPPPAMPAPQMDPQTAMLMQQAGMNNNIQVASEFDPPMVQLGDRVTYRVTVTAMPEGVWVPDKLPEVKGLSVGSPVHGFNYLGVSFSVQPRTTYNFKVQPATNGVYVMPALMANVNGRTVAIPSCSLTVVPPGTPGVIKPLLLRLEVPAGEFFIGQMVPVQFVQYEPPGNNVQTLSQPQINGDSVMSEQALMGYRREMRNAGNQMVPAHVLIMNVIPVKEGAVTFSGQAFAYVAGARNQLAAGSPMDIVLIDSDPVTIQVRHVPAEGELPGYTGAIGTFAVDRPIMATNIVKAGEPVVLTVLVRGQGNLTRLVPPKAPNVPGWQMMEPAGDATGSIQIQLRNAAVFTYTMVPLSDKITDTPAIPFSYFDPVTRRYMDATIPALPIKVLPGPGGSIPIESVKPAGPGVDDPDLVPEGKRFVFIQAMQQPGVKSACLAPLQQRVGFLLFQLAPAIIIGGLWGWDRRRRYLARHPDVVRRARTRRSLRRHMRRMQRAVACGNTPDFIRAAVDAFRAAAAPAHAAHPEALVCDDVLRAMPASDQSGPPGNWVKRLFAAHNADQFAGQPEQQKKEQEAVLAGSVEISRVLTDWRMRL